MINVQRKLIDRDKSAKIFGDLIDAYIGARVRLGPGCVLCNPSVMGLGHALLVSFEVEPGARYQSIAGGWVDYVRKQRRTRGHVGTSGSVVDDGGIPLWGCRQIRVGTTHLVTERGHDLSTQEVAKKFAGVFDMQRFLGDHHRAEPQECAVFGDHIGDSVAVACFVGAGARLQLVTRPGQHHVQFTVEQVV